MNRIYLCNHFHCDPIFTCPQSVHIAESIELARQYVDATLEDPDFTCVLSEIDYLQGYWNIHVEDRSRFLGLLESNRIESSGSYSEPNENSIGGEALLRNLVYGQWWLVDYLGARGDVYLPFDVFGHVCQLPQLLARCGFMGTAWTKGSVRLSRDNFELSYWRAPDGSRVLNQIASYGLVDWQCSDSVDQLRRMANEAPSGAHLVFRGADFVSPPSWSAGELNSQPSRYFSDAHRAITEGELTARTTSREMSLYHSGTALSHSDLKIATRLAEETVSEAETWATLATLYGVEYPEASIDHAWRQILFCQHHDSITGTSNDQSYLDLMSHLREAVEEGAEARRGAVTELARRIDTLRHEGMPVVVFNSLNVTRAETVVLELDSSIPDGPITVRDDSGTALPSVVERDGSGGTLRFTAPDVPGIGYRTFWMTLDPATESGAGESPTLSSVSAPLTLATDTLEVTIDPSRGGGITRIRDLLSDTVFSVDDRPLNDFVRLEEGPCKEPSWEYNTIGEPFYASSLPATVVAERTAVGWVVTVTQEFPDTDGLVRRYHLTDGVQSIECSVEIRRYSGSNRPGRDRIDLERRTTEELQESDPENRHLFGVLFPADDSGSSPRWSDRFGSRVIRRSTGWLDFRTHQDRIYSGSGLYSAEKWIALTPDVSLTLYRDTGNIGIIPFGMVRVIYPGCDEYRRAADELITGLCRRGITATPYLDDEDQLNDPLQTDQIIALGGDDVNAWVGSQEALQGIAETRFVRDVHLGGDFDKTVPVLVVQSTDIASEVARVVEELRAGEIYIDAGSVVSGAVVRKAAKGLAILNRGTIAASCESDGALFMALQHSGGWCDWATPLYLEHSFIPERKTSMYHYAIVPFAGSWIDAGIPVRAACYNRPLSAVTADRHSGSLPPVSRLLSILGRAILVSAVKPEGHPSAGFKASVMDAGSGMVTRLWNWDGDTDAAEIRTWTGLNRAVISDPTEKVAVPLPLPVRAEGIVHEVGSNAVETLIIVPNSPAGSARPDGNDTSRRRRVFSRWWLHNRGAAPSGNMPASVTLRGELFPGEKSQVLVSVANNRVDRSLRGEVVLCCGEGWQVDRSRIPVDLSPMSGSVTPVEVTVPQGGSGRLDANLSVGETTYIDSICVGEASPFDVEVSTQAGEVSVVVTNPGNQPVDAWVTLVSPLETWPVARGAWSVAFRETELLLHPGESRQVTMHVRDGFFDSCWAYIKTAAAGRTAYTAIPMPRTATVRRDRRRKMMVSFDAPLADLSLVIDTESGNAEDLDVERLGASPRTITRFTSPIRGCDPSPVPGMRSYWKIDGLDTSGAFEVEARTVPVDLGGLRNPESARLSFWSGSEWRPVATEFDPDRWSFRGRVPAAAVSGESMYLTLTGATDVVWSTYVGGRFFDSEPWVGDLDGDGETSVVIGTAHNEIIALTRNGAIRWRRRFGGWIWPSVRFGCFDPDGDGRFGIVVTPSDSSIALLEAGGRIVWRRGDLPFSRKSSPVFGDIDRDGNAEILVTIRDHGLWAFDARGSRLWNAGAESAVFSRPVIARTPAGTLIYVSVNGRRLVAYDGDGVLRIDLELSSGPPPERSVAAPVIAPALSDERSVILYAGYNDVLSILETDGTMIEQIDVGGPMVGAPAIIGTGNNRRIICATETGLLVVISNGEVVARYDTRSSIQGDVVAVDLDGDGEEEILVGTTPELYTYVFDSSGVLAAKIPVGAIWSNTPAVLPLSDGGSAVVVGGADERVTAVRIRTTPVRGCRSSDVIGAEQT